MFDWDDKDTKFVLRMHVLTFFLLLIPVFGTFVSVAYLSLIGPLIFPLGGYFYLLQYSFGIRLVYLIPDIVLATHLVVTPLTVFLVAVFVTSWVLIITRLRNLSFLWFLRRTEGYERYRDVKALVRSFASKRAEGRTTVILGWILFTSGFLSATLFLLSKIMMCSSETSKILALVLLFIFLPYSFDVSAMRERFTSFVQRKTGNIET